MSYEDLMNAAGYEQAENTPPPSAIPGAIKRYSNAHIVQLLEELQQQVRQLHELTASLADAKLDDGQSIHGSSS